MSEDATDALVFFGATGDLAYKKIFPALAAMQKRGKRAVPIIGVAKSAWTLDQLVARARDSVQKHGVYDSPSFDQLAARLRYVDGDYSDVATFRRIKQELGSSKQVNSVRLSARADARSRPNGFSTMTRAPAAQPDWCS